jgi:hypothetical protein
MEEKSLVLWAKLLTAKSGDYFDRKKEKVCLLVSAASLLRLNSSQMSAPLQSRFVANMP